MNIARSILVLVALATPRFAAGSPPNPIEADQHAAHVSPLTSAIVEQVREATKWRENPRGTFVDWNPRVSCEGR